MSNKPWTPEDMSYRPSGLPQDFIKHQVESAEDWSEWVCPDPKSYLMKCCDCGLVHEAQFGVVQYAVGSSEDCEPVSDQNVQAVFRMKRHNSKGAPVPTGLIEVLKELK